LFNLPEIERKMMKYLIVILLTVFFGCSAVVKAPVKICPTCPKIQGYELKMASPSCVVKEIAVFFDLPYSEISSLRNCEIARDAITDQIISYKPHASLYLTIYLS